MKLVSMQKADSEYSLSAFCNGREKHCIGDDELLCFDWFYQFPYKIFLLNSKASYLCGNIEA